MRNLHFKFIAVLLVCALMMACPLQKAQSVEHQFALNTNRVARGTGDALRAIDYLFDQKIISKDGAISATRKVQLANAANGKLIQAAQQYIVVEDGKRVFRLTDQGVMDVQKAIDVTVASFNDALNDPVFQSNDARLNEGLKAFAQSLSLAVKSFLTIKRQLKPGVSVEVSNG